MGYKFTIRDAVHVKEDKEYPWPCVFDKKRTIMIFKDDVLTEENGGTYFKHTGLGCSKIKIPKEDVVPFEDDCHLQML